MPTVVLKAQHLGTIDHAADHKKLSLVVKIDNFTMQGERRG